MTDPRKVIPFYYSPSGDTEEDKKILEPFEYVRMINEKHWCPKLTVVFNYWLKIPSDKLRQIDEIISIVYNMCLLYDDMQDKSIFRDGIPVAHSVYGISSTISASNYVQLVAFEKAINLHPAAVKILLEALLEFNRGQGMDMYWKNNLMCPSGDDYKMMAEKKVGWFVKLMVKLMKLFSLCEKDFSTLLNLVGYHYQIHNDYCNLCKNINDKNYCDDLTEGKFSFPLIHAIRCDDKRRIINILKQRTTNTNIKSYCVDLLEELGSFKYTRDKLKELDKKMRIEMESLGDNPLFINMLKRYEKQICHSSKADNNVVTNVR